MKTIPEIIGLFGSDSEFGRACGFTKHPAARAGDIKRRQKIPPKHWPALVAEAKRRRLPLTWEVLVAANEASARVSEQETAA